jgi:hypothetical protein
VEIEVVVIVAEEEEVEVDFLIVEAAEEEEEVEEVVEDRVSAIGTIQNKVVDEVLVRTVLVYSNVLLNLLHDMT